MQPCLGAAHYQTMGKPNATPKKGYNIEILNANKKNIETIGLIDLIFMQKRYFLCSL